MLGRLLAVFLITAAPTRVWTQETTPPSPKIVSPLQPLLDALDRANASGSLVLSDCDVGQRWHFPHLRSPSDSRGSLLQVVREMFADDPAMQVTQDADGMVRMIEDGAQTDLLNVRISHIRYAAFSSTTALQQILQSPEVATFMKNREMDLAIRPQGALVNNPFSEESPHIAESMNDVALSQALDRVLKTFPGIWVYENCRDYEKSRSVFLRFFSVKHPLLVEE